MLSIKIRNHHNIEGILDNRLPNFNMETKILQYADDLSLFLKPGNSLTNALHIVEQFYHFSGLRLNRNKSIGMLLGEHYRQRDNKEGLVWLKPNENMKILGTFFNAHKESSLIEENWIGKIDNIKILIQNWSKRNISIWGKCLVAKTFFLSKINYIIQSLALPFHILKIINDLIFKFLWKTESNKNGYERINRKTLCLPTALGGLSMISIEDQQHMLLLKWLKRIHTRYKNNQHETHVKIVNYFLRNLGGIHYITLSNLTRENFKGLTTVKSTYWKRVIEAWLIHG